MGQVIDCAHLFSVLPENPAEVAVDIPWELSLLSPLPLSPPKNTDNGSELWNIP